MREGYTRGRLVVWAYYPPGHHPSLDALPPERAPGEDGDGAAPPGATGTADQRAEPAAPEPAFGSSVAVAAPV